MSTTCPEYDMAFSRKYVMLRHKINKHGTTQSFTLMAIGPTFSGKSCWMNRLLNHAKTMINPPPERIIYYTIWQPLFSEMQRR